MLNARPGGIRPVFGFITSRVLLPSNKLSLVFLHRCYLEEEASLQLRAPLNHYLLGQYARMILQVPLRELLRGALALEHGVSCVPYRLI
jgi:hypothetical protein